MPENALAAGVPKASERLGKQKHHVAIQSKVKQQLQQARELREQRGQARQQRLQNVLGPR